MQLASRSRLGRGSCRFESCRLDHYGFHKARVSNANEFDKTRISEKGG